MPQEKTSDNFKSKLSEKLQHFFDKPSYNNYNFTLSSPYDGQAPSMPTTQDLQENEKKFEVKNIFPSLRCFFRIH